MVEQIQIEEPIELQHPVYVAPTREQAAAMVAEHGVAQLAEYMRVRNARIRAEMQDPLNYGFELPTWVLTDVLAGFCSRDTFVQKVTAMIGIYAVIRPDVAVSLREWLADGELMAAIAAGPYKHILILGGNASGKTEYVCRRGVKDATRYKEAEIWIFHMSEDMSVRYHQKRAHGYMPGDWRNAGKKGNPAYYGYKSQTGYSDNKVTGPNGSLIWFKNYQQDEDAAIEGGELGDPLARQCLGYACDELVPQNWLETLRFRLSRRPGAVGLLSFTPKYGYSETVAWFLDGARLVRAERGVILDKPKPMPLVRVGPRGAVVNFHSRYNPYPLTGSYAELVGEVKADNDEVKAIRIYGHAEETRQHLFKRLRREVHCFKGDN